MPFRYSFLFVAALLIAGCGKSETSSPVAASPPAQVAAPTGAPLSLDEYNAHLKASNDKLNAIQTTFRADTAAAKALATKDEQFAKLKEINTDWAPKVSAVVDEFKAMNPPADLQKFHKNLVFWTVKVAEASKAVMNDLIAGDTAQMEKESTGLQTDMQMMMQDIQGDLKDAGYVADDATGMIKKKV